MTDSDRTTATTLLAGITADMLVVEDMAILDDDDSIVVRIATPDGRLAVHLWADLRNMSLMATKLRRELQRIRRNRRPDRPPMETIEDLPTDPTSLAMCHHDLIAELCPTCNPAGVR